MTTNTVRYDANLGPDIPQGDLLLTNLHHPVFRGRFTESTAAGPLIRKGDGSIRLLEGEVTGHHHEIVFGSRHLARFRDVEMGHEIASASAVPVGSARLAADDALLTALIRSGDWHERYRNLHIGFLTVEDGPVDLIHPEHDAWRLPAGLYAVGRQVESVGAEERAVQD